MDPPRSPSAPSTAPLVAITGAEDKTARIWDLTTRTSRGGPLTGHTSWVWSVDFGEIDGKPIAVTGSEDRTARVWDLTTGAEIGAPSKATATASTT